MVVCTLGFESYPAQLLSWYCPRRCFVSISNYPKEWQIFVPTIFILFWKRFVELNRLFECVRQINTFSNEAKLRTKKYTKVYRIPQYACNVLFFSDVLSSRKEYFLFILFGLTQYHQYQVCYILFFTTGVPWRYVIKTPGCIQLSICLYFYRPVTIL